MAKVALITGAGIGLATARRFASKGWTIAVTDLNTFDGENVAREFKGTFYKTNVTDYDNLAHTFAQVWKKYGRLDFVFANAGIVEKVKFYEEHKGAPGNLPPRLDSAVLDINLKSVITTSYLALHFFRQNKLPGGNLVITASVGGLYPTPYLPMYAAAKHGCVGFTRSIAENLAGSGIRVNCICPGSVATGLLKKEEWSRFPQETFTPVETVAEAVYMLVEDGNLTGQSVELVQDRLHLRAPPEPLDPALKKMMSKTVAFRRQSS